PPRPTTAHHRRLPPFPTRRSSDLMGVKTPHATSSRRWNGQCQDTDTGLYYLRARYYDPQTAQFISVDPLAAITKAVYTYANNNPDRKSTRLNSSHQIISYAVFCLK